MGRGGFDEFDEDAKPASADGEDGEAPVVSDEVDFLEPGESLTDESDIHEPAPDESETANQ